MGVIMRRFFTNVVLGAVLAGAGCATAPDAPATTVVSDLLTPPPMASAPLAADAVLTRIAFGSCYVPQFEEREIWNAVRVSQPDAFLFLGDNVYQTEEKGEPELIELREAYAMLAADEPFARLRSETPVLPIWDDHDYGINDAGVEMPVKYESEALFDDVWAVPADDERRARDGVYFSRRVGPPGRRVQIIMLDTRFFRSPYAATDNPDIVGQERYVPDADPSKTMLGEAQWSWLEAELRQPADLRIIASSVQIFADGHGFEGWRMMPRERERFLDLIADTGANGVVLVSGDRHFGGLYESPAGAPYMIAEVTSSSLNNPFNEERLATHSERDPARVGEMLYAANFGVIAIDWEAGTLALELHDGTGAVARRMELTLADLAAP